MKVQVGRLGVAVILLALLTGCTPKDRDLEDLATWLTGSFSSQAQAAADSAFFDIRLEMARIWAGRRDGIWLYVEQAAAAQRDQPYRQRIYQLTRHDAHSLQSVVYLLPRPERFVGAWRNSTLLDSLTPDSLSVRDGCAIRLQRQDNGSFTGGTVGRDCRSELQGAAYATSEVEITPDYLVSWDRGFDANGLQVWGAAEGGYVFKRVGAAVSAASAGTDVVVGVSLLTRTHPFYQELEAGLREAAARHGYELIVQAGEFDVARQKDQVENFLVRQVDAIIVCPCDSKSIGTAVQAANTVGIPVFTADIAVLAEGTRVVCHVASDNVAGGKLAARAVVEALGGQGTVAIIDHPEVESVIQRVHGFESELARQADLQVVAKLTGKGVKDVAFRTAEDILQAHPDLDAIFGINDDTILGVLAAVEKAGRQERIVLVGFDAVPEARRAIGAGKIYADVVQQPRRIGAATINAIADYLAGREVPPAILIPCELFTREDALAEPRS